MASRSQLVVVVALIALTAKLEVNVFRGPGGEGECAADRISWICEVSRGEEKVMLTF